MQLELPLGSPWEVKRTHIENKVTSYEAGRIALTIREVDQMYEERQEVLKNCPHDTVEFCTGTYTDRGYGLDRYWPTKWIRCKCCDKTLWGSDGDGDDTRVIASMPSRDVFHTVPKDVAYSNCSRDERDLKVRF